MDVVDLILKRRVRQGSNSVEPPDLTLIQISQQSWKKTNLDSPVTALGFTIPTVIAPATYLTSQTLYDNTYTATSGTAIEKRYAALKASAMFRFYDDTPEDQLLYGGQYNTFAMLLIQEDIDRYNSTHLSKIYGVRVPTEMDYQILFENLGGISVAGGHLKEAGLEHWNSPNTGADNSSGFTALPSGNISDGWPNSIHWYFNAHTITPSGSNYKKLMLTNDRAFTQIQDTDSNVVGNAIRLIKDETYKTSWINRKVSFLGDSVTGAFLQQVLTLLRINAVACWEGGTRVSNSLGGMCTDERINAIPADSELVIVNGGINDWSGNVTFGESSNTETWTFCGAINTVINKIKVRCPNAVILVTTTTYAKREDFTDNKNGYGLTPDDYAQAIRDAVALRNDVELLDFNSLLGWNESNIAQKTIDLVHPNILPGLDIAKLIVAKLGTITPNV